MIGGARRVRLGDAKETDGRSVSEEPKQRELKMQIHEKENAEVLPLASSHSLPSSQPLAEVNLASQRSLSTQGRQVLPIPSRRLLKKIETISENEDGELLAYTLNDLLTDIRIQVTISTLSKLKDQYRTLTYAHEDQQVLVKLTMGSRSPRNSNSLLDWLLGRLVELDGSLLKKRSGKNARLHLKKVHNRPYSYILFLRVI